MILSSITLQAFTGSGLFKGVNSAKIEYKRGQIKEKLQLNLTSEQISNPTGDAEEIIQATHDSIKKSELEELGGKYIEIGELSKTENFEETEWYFNVIVDGDIYKVSLSGANFIGNTDEMAPAIMISKISNTTNTITVTVETERNEGGKLQYYLKSENDSDYKMVKESQENTFTYEDLIQGVKYSVKVVAVAKNKKTAEVTR